MSDKIQLAILTSVFFVLLATGASASIAIDIEVKPQFAIGEKISFNYTFVSDLNEEIKYVASVDCPEAPKPLLDLKSTTLEKDKPLEEEYVYMEVVTEDTKPQICRVLVGIMEPFELSEEKSFEIVTELGFKFEVFLYKDQSRAEKSKVFVKGQNIYIDYYSSIHDPSITAFLTYPDETTQQITIPGTIKAEHTGTYDLDVTASKEGYRTVSVKEQFGVIEMEAVIQTFSVCNKNGICDGGETEENCPHDCVKEEEPEQPEWFPKQPEKEKTTKEVSIDTTFYLLLIGVIVILFFLNYGLKKAEKQIKSWRRKRRKSKKREMIKPLPSDS